MHYFSTSTHAEMVQMSVTLATEHRNTPFFHTRAYETGEKNSSMATLCIEHRHGIEEDKNTATQAVQWLWKRLLHVSAYKQM